MSKQVGIRNITSDLIENDKTAGNRALRSLDSRSEAYFALRGVLNLIDWVNESHAAGAKLYAEFIAPADKYVIITADVVYTDSPSLVLSVYNDYTATAGSPLIIRPVRAGQVGVENIESASVVRRVSDPVINAPFVARTPVFSTPSGNTGGATAAGSLVRILPPNSPFLVELHNRDNATHYSQYELRWAEVSPEFLLEIGL